MLLPEVAIQGFQLGEQLFGRVQAVWISGALHLVQTCPETGDGGFDPCAEQLGLPFTLGKGSTGEIIERQMVHWLQSTVANERVREVNQEQQIGHTIAIRLEGPLNVGFLPGLEQILNYSSLPCTHMKILLSLIIRKLSEHVHLMTITK